MSNKESRIKSLPDVFMLSSGLVQFKYKPGYWQCKRC